MSVETDTTRFAFGENWTSFLATVNEDSVHEAARALSSFLGRETLADVRMLDLGSGSGLSSLAAIRLGAASVHSVDYDPQSVAATHALKRRWAPSSVNWTIEQGDATDREWMRGLGRFDLVYSWGVLHHTGAMWRALEAACDAVDDGGRLFVSIYNDQGWRSRVWARVKARYVRLPPRLRTPYVIAVMAPRELISLVFNSISGHFLDYVRSWTRYRERRGMSRWHDLVDWVGGHPFEVAKPEEVFDFCSRRGFRLERLRTAGGGLGTNEFLFVRESPEGDGHRSR